MPDRTTARTILFTLLFFLLYPAHHCAYSSSTDGYGGHYNKKYGKYHSRSGNKTTTAEIVSKQESGGKNATRSTKIFVVGDGSLSVRKEQAVPLINVTFRGKVVGVTDGDTIMVMRGRKKVKVRLYGIDTPEMKQPYGQSSKRFTDGRVSGRTVDIESIDTDSHGQTVGLVAVDGINVNEALVRSGYAWVYDRYCKKSFCEEWKILESKARKKELGLWQIRNPQAPWDWRRKRRKK